MQLKNTATPFNLQKLYKNEMGADIQFVLASKVIDGEMKVPAHKAILAAASPVFEKMFYGDLMEGAEVTITDISFEAFVEFLQFFYVHVIELTECNIFEVFKLIDKYNLLGCQTMCQNYLTDTVTAELVSLYYDVALTFRYPQETVKTLEEIICLETQTVLESNSFRNSSEIVLKKMLQIDELNCSEVDVFNAAMSWATGKCVEKELSPSDKNLKSELGVCFTLIRFATMTEKELVSCSEKYSDLFEMKEFCDILQYILCKRSMTCALHYNTTPRHAPNLVVPFRDTYSFIKEKTYPSKEYISDISFQITRGINVHLVCFDVVVPASQTIECTINLNGVEIQTRSALDILDARDDSTFQFCRLNLKEPVFCEVNKDYTFLIKSNRNLDGFIELEEIQQKNVRGIHFNFINRNIFVMNMQFQIDVKAKELETTRK